MPKVFVNIGLSLDGYMAPEGMTMGKPEYKNWGAKWGALMAWILNSSNAWHAAGPSKWPVVGGGRPRGTLPLRPEFIRRPPDPGA